MLSLQTQQQPQNAFILAPNYFTQMTSGLSQTKPLKRTMSSSVVSLTYIVHYNVQCTMSRDGLFLGEFPWLYCVSSWRIRTVLFVCLFDVQDSVSLSGMQGMGTRQE